MKITDLFSLLPMPSWIPKLSTWVDNPGPKMYLLTPAVIQCSILPWSLKSLWVRNTFEGVLRVGTSVVAYFWQVACPTFCLYNLSLKAKTLFSWQISKASKISSWVRSSGFGGRYSKYSYIPCLLTSKGIEVIKLTLSVIKPSVSHFSIFWKKCFLCWIAFEVAKVLKSFSCWIVTGNYPSGRKPWRHIMVFFIKFMGFGLLVIWLWFGI